MRHIFLSPHLDDAVLSCGQKIHSLVRARQEVIVITIFTQFSGFPVSLQTYRKYVIASGFFRINVFNRSRLIEDKRALSVLKAKWMHLGFLDGGFRKKPFPNILEKTLLPLGIGHGYIYPWHNQKDFYSGLPSKFDQPLISQILYLLTKHLQPSDCLYAPIGIGDHVDHIITNQIAQKIHASYYWLDQPYAHKATINHLTEKLKKYRLSTKLKSHKIKKNAISQYLSQVPFLYPNGIVLHEEKYYTLK